MTTLRTMRNCTRRGYSLVNMLITIAVISIVAAAVVPSAANGGDFGPMNASMLMASDIEYAQSLSLSSPNDLAVVRFDTEVGAYWIAHLSDTETPIARPGRGEPYRIDFGVGEAQAAAGVTMTVQDIVSGMIVFDKFGRLTSLNDAQIVLSDAGGAVRTVVVNASTGSVRIQ